MRVFAHIAYGFILRLHPHDFRVEFGDEMLWIFDEQMGSAEDGVARVVLCAQLLLDALRSAFIQRALRKQQQPETLAPHFDQLEASPSVVQIAQGSFMVLSFLFSIFSIVLCLKMVFSSL